MYSYKIEQAIKAAALLHQDQLRKGPIQLPYITHLMSVMTILRDYTTDENTLVAALLHDTLEDTDYTAEELETDFGKEIAELVLTVTEPPQPTDKKIPWLEIKKEYAKQIKKGPEAAALIAAADKIHNFRCIVDEYHDNYNQFVQDFGKQFDDRLEAYQDIANAINSRLKDGIVHEFNHTFKEYTDFIFAVQDSYEKI